MTHPAPVFGDSYFGLIGRVLLKGVGFEDQRFGIYNDLTI